MKKIVSILLGCLITWLSQAQTPLPDCVSLKDAERILGQSAHLAHSSIEEKKNITQYKCTYTADATDSLAHETGNLYYMLEVYNNATSTHKAYDDIIQSNRHHSGLSKISDIGDQAYLHSDGTNFHLLIFIKGNKMIRLKVNQVTSTTSLETLKEVAKDLALKI